MELVPDHWIETSTRTGGGRRFSNPDRLGEQIRLMPGYPDDENPVKRGPYALVSKDGTKWRVPLKDNPTIRS